MVIHQRDAGETMISDGKTIALRKGDTEGRSVYVYFNTGGVTSDNSNDILHTVNTAKDDGTPKTDGYLVKGKSYALTSDLPLYAYKPGEIKLHEVISSSELRRLSASWAVLQRQGQQNHRCKCPKQAVSRPCEGTADKREGPVSQEHAPRRAGGRLRADQVRRRLQTLPLSWQCTHKCGVRHRGYRSQHKEDDLRDGCGTEQAKAVASEGRATRGTEAGADIRGLRKQGVMEAGSKEVGDFAIRQKSPTLLTPKEASNLAVKSHPSTKKATNNHLLESPSFSAI